MWFLFVANTDDLRVLMKNCLWKENFHIAYFLLSLFLTQQLRNWNIPSVQKSSNSSIAQKIWSTPNFFSPQRSFCSSFVKLCGKYILFSNWPGNLSQKSKDIWSVAAPGSHCKISSQSKSPRNPNYNLVK